MVKRQAVAKPQPLTQYAATACRHVYVCVCVCVWSSVLFGIAYQKGKPTKQYGTFVHCFCEDEWVCGAVERERERRAIPGRSYVVVTFVTGSLTEWTSVSSRSSTNVGLISCNEHEPEVEERILSGSSFKGSVSDTAARLSAACIPRPYACKRHIMTPP